MQKRIYASNEIKVKVYAGDKGSNVQLEAFKEVWNECKILKECEAELVIMHHSEAKELGWGVVQIINWLEDSEIHIILCHMHQGKKSKDVPWDCSELMLALRRLTYHLGFPMLQELRCPIFTQNKILYIDALSEVERSNYTLPIALPNFTKHTRAEIKDIFDDFKINKMFHDIEDVVSDLKSKYNLETEDETFKCVYKFPYKTNGDCIKYPNNLKQLRTCFVKSCGDKSTGKSVPYGMIQPFLTNGKEYKIILLNGKAQFKTIKNNHDSKSYSDETTLFKFAEDSLVLLKERLHGTISDGLVRVDIMETNDGKLIVNEFESFEARYEKNETTDLKVRNCLKEFWSNILEKLFPFV